LAAEEVPEERIPDVAAGRNKPAKAGGGENRRGREKRRGRNVVGCGKLDAELTPLAGVAKGTRTLEEEPLAHGRRAGGKQLRTLKGRSSSGEDEPVLNTQDGGRYRGKPTERLETGSSRWKQVTQYAFYFDTHKTL
jgi:hypothetical protein